MSVLESSSFVRNHSYFENLHKYEFRILDVPEGVLALLGVPGDIKGDGVELFLDIVKSIRAVSTGLTVDENRLSRSEFDGLNIPFCRFCSTCWTVVGFSEIELSDCRSEFDERLESSFKPLEFAKMDFRIFDKFESGGDEPGVFGVFGVLLGGDDLLRSPLGGEESRRGTGGGLSLFISFKLVC